MVGDCDTDDPALLRQQALHPGVGDDLDTVAAAVVGQDPARIEAILKDLGMAA